MFPRPSPDTDVGGTGCDVEALRTLSKDSRAASALFRADSNLACARAAFC